MKLFTKFICVSLMGIAMAGTAQAASPASSSSSLALSGATVGLITGAASQLCEKAVLSVDKKMNPAQRLFVWPLESTVRWMLVSDLAKEASRNGFWAAGLSAWAASWIGWGTIKSLKSFLEDL